MQDRPGCDALKRLRRISRLASRGRSRWCSPSTGMAWRLRMLLAAHGDGQGRRAGGGTGMRQGTIGTVAGGGRAGVARPGRPATSRVCPATSARAGRGRRGVWTGYFGHTSPRVLTARCQRLQRMREAEWPLEEDKRGHGGPPRGKSCRALGPDGQCRGCPTSALSSAFLGSSAPKFFCWHDDQAGPGPAGARWQVNPPWRRVKNDCRKYRNTESKISSSESRS